jgi:hypothetical protein
MNNLTTKQLNGTVVNNILNKMRILDKEDPGVSLPPFSTVETSGSTGGSAVSPLMQASVQSSMGSNPTIVCTPAGAPMIPEWYREKHKQFKTKEARYEEWYSFELKDMQST